MHSNVTVKNVSWPHFSWPTLYIAGRPSSVLQDSVTLCTLGMGTAFGESILNDSPRHSTVVTREYCELLRVEQKDFKILWEVGSRQSLPWNVQGPHWKGGSMRPDAPSSALSVHPRDRRKSRRIIFWTRSIGDWKLTFLTVINVTRRHCAVCVILAPFTNVVKHDLLTYLFRVSSEMVRVGDSERMLIRCSVTSSWCRPCSTRTAPSACRPSMVSTALAFLR